MCNSLHRQPEHVIQFLFTELGTTGSVDGSQQLIIKGRWQQKQIENVLRRYIGKCCCAVSSCMCSNTKLQWNMLLVRLVRVQTLSYPKTIVFTLCNVNHVVLHDLYLLSRLVSRPKLEMTGGRLEHNRFHSTPKNTLLFLFPATSHIYLFSSCFNDSYTSLSLSQLSCCTA